MNKTPVSPTLALAQEIRRTAADLLERAKKLETPPRIARGTRRDLTPQAILAAKPTPAPVAPRTYVGDEGPTTELMQSVHLLLVEKPRTFQELLEATGARDNRIKGVLMRMQREGVEVVNLGSETRAIWFCPGPEAKKRLAKILRKR